MRLIVGFDAALPIVIPEPVGVCDAVVVGTADYVPPEATEGGLDLRWQPGGRTGTGSRGGRPRRLLGGRPVGGGVG